MNEVGTYIRPATFPASLPENSLCQCKSSGLELELEPEEFNLGDNLSERW
jgi:hypothetical protein